jgi:hypothetical protein
MKALLGETMPDKQTDTRSAILAVLSREPNLTDAGFAPGSTETLLCEESEFDAVCRWLTSGWESSSRSLERRPAFSHKLKDLASGDLKTFISHGTLIAAAIHMGFEYDKEHGNALLWARRKVKLPKPESKADPSSITGKFFFCENPNSKLVRGRILAAVSGTVFLVETEGDEGQRLIQMKKLLSWNPRLYSNVTARDLAYEKAKSKLPQPRIASV